MSNEIEIQEEYFTVVRNDVLKDKTLSARAKGVYCYLISNAKSFKIYKTELHNHFSEGRDAIIKAFNELVSAGWIVEKKGRKEKGRFTSPDYYVYRYKEGKGSPVPENPKPEKPKPVNQELISINSNKYQSNKNNNVSNETLCEFDSFWIKAKSVYKKHNYNIGNKEPARKAFNRIKDVDLNYLKTSLFNQVERKGLIKSKGEFTANPRNLSTWLNNKGWTEELEPIPVNKSFKTPPGSAQPPLNGMRRINKL
jgi:hypothetical protein